MDGLMLECFYVSESLRKRNFQVFDSQKKYSIESYEKLFLLEYGWLTYEHLY